MAVNALYTSHATAVGGRNGTSKSADGLVDVQLSVPKAMGGPGKPGATTPEDLFAAGYAACFGGAVDYQANQLKLKPSAVKVETAVGIGPDSAGGFGLKVDLKVTVSGLAKADAERLVAAGHAMCPYSKAIKGNVEVALEVVAA